MEAKDDTAARRSTFNSRKRRRKGKKKKKSGRKGKMRRAVGCALGIAPPPGADISPVCMEAEATES